MSGDGRRGIFRDGNCQTIGGERGYRSHFQRGEQYAGVLMPGGGVCASGDLSECWRSIGGGAWRGWM